MSSASSSYGLAPVQTGGHDDGERRLTSVELDGLEELAVLRRQVANDASPEAQRRLLEIMEAETRATREAVARATAAYGSKPPNAAQTTGPQSPCSDSSGTSSQRRSYRESPRRTPSPGSPDTQMSLPQTESSFQRRVQFG